MWLEYVIRPAREKRQGLRLADMEYYATKVKGAVTLFTFCRGAWFRTQSRAPAYTQSRRNCETVQ